MTDKNVAHIDATDKANNAVTFKGNATQLGLNLKASLLQEMKTSSSARLLL